jgi:tetratricopeptide (TPR) repeat protein
VKITVGTPQSTLRQFTAILALSALFSAGCTRNSGLPEVGSKEYRDYCSAFYIGLAGLQSGEDVRAKRELTRATQLVPAEPVGWADLGILEIRQQQFDAAFTSVEKARSLAPDSSRMEELLGLIESRRGKASESLAHFRKAVSLDGKNLKALYALADETARQGLPGSDAESAQTLERILSVEPENAAVLLDIVRLAAKSGDAARLKETLQRLKPLTGNWPAAARQQFAAIEQTASSGSPQSAAVQVQFLRNVLVRVPAYRQNLDEVRTPANLGAQPISRFLRLPVPSSEPAPVDAKLAFAARDLPGVSANGVLWVGAIALNDQGTAAVIWADAGGVHVPGGPVLPLPRGTSGMSVHAVAGADLNYDFKTDLIVATAGGLKLYRQIDPQHFQDVTSETKLPAGILDGSYTGAWAFDFDLDGDLDIVLGSADGEPLVLRNNGDGGFAALHPFKGVDGLVAFAVADIDGDGDPDVALIDKNGRLITFTNERLGDFHRREVPAALAEGNLALAAADVNSDGRLDFVVLRSDFSVVRLSGGPEGQAWDTGELVKAKPAKSAPGQVTLLIADLDNNGALDLIAGDQVFLGDGRGYVPLADGLQTSSASLADLDGNGRLDIVGLRDGRAAELTNHGAQNYHWQTIRTRAAHATGDQRINSFGIGGEIELRSDLFTQKQMITSPILHFGLGTHTGIDFARIVWPNGSMQAEFDLKPDQEVMAEQRIKGSCPMLFTWNGQRMQFLKDVGPWGSALGLNVNAQGKGVYPTGEWFTIASDELKPHDGFYDLRITAEYWETYYMDHYSLLVVDHPADSEVFADERFALPPPPSKVIATQCTKPFAHAWDDKGQDVTEVVREQDASFLGHFDKGEYQGIARDHWVELELPADAPAVGPLYLIGAGWIHDTDASVVKALSQNGRVAPQQMSIEVPDASGHWITARQGLGFLKGRLKTVVLDISGIFRPGAPRRLRLRTNLEIYWNKLSWAPGLPSQEHAIKVQHLSLAAADLRYRGFSRITQANETSPEVPNYDVIEESALKWHDQEGLVTRYGDVRELLTEIDDRFVITSPGDELRMRFNAPAAPAAGWKRDFILICDGWVKDGDYNSTFSKTVSPLPYHGMTEYNTAPAMLELERAYRLHPADWQTYQTRYVTPAYFETALWGR